MRFLIPLIAAMLALGGCGSDPSTDATGAATPDKTQPAEAPDASPEAADDPGESKVLSAVEKVAKCMRDKGYDMPEVTPEMNAIAPENVDGMDPDKVNKDAQDCAAAAK
jgi:hypothetical protein